MGIREQVTEPHAAWYRFVDRVAAFHLQHGKVPARVAIPRKLERLIRAWAMASGTYYLGTHHHPIRPAKLLGIRSICWDAQQLRLYGGK